VETAASVISLWSSSSWRLGVLVTLGRLVILFSLICATAFPASLVEKQSKFSVMVAMLILQAGELGYDVTLGEAWRSPEQASFQTKINAEKGIGIAASNHTIRLAIDLNLVRNGKYLTDVEDYRPLGEWWEKQCRDCRWGGRFKMRDAVHFSFQWGKTQ
jgi:hypothetical protein